MIFPIAMLLALQFNFTETVVPLSKAPKGNIPLFLPTNVASDGSVVMATNTRFWHWNADGTYIQSVSVSDNSTLKLFLDVRFDPEKKIYWIADLEGRAILLNEKGRILSANVPMPQSDGYKNLSYRYLIPSKDFTFGVAKGFENLVPNIKAKALTPLFVEGKIVEKSSSVMPAESFFILNDLQIQTFYNYKDHWVIFDRAEKGYYIVSSMSRFIRFYQNTGTKNAPIFEEKRQHPFYKSDDFIVPDLTAPRRIRSTQELVKWLGLFPRISGFYAFGDGFLICYQIPSNEEGLANRVIMHRLDKKGGIIGTPIEIQETVIGAHQQSVYTLEKGDFGVRLKLLQFKD